MKRINENPPLTDKELNDIIAAPRPETLAVLCENDLKLYLDTHDGRIEPAWKCMERGRMNELFTRFLKCGWIKSSQVDRVEAAMEQL